mgnify:CR=1 FL=1
MKKMDIELEKQKTKKNDEPIATMVIKEYQQVNKSYAKTNKRLTIIILILLMLLAAETTYIILYWDSLHPHAGMITENSSE